MDSLVPATFRGLKKLLPRLLSAGLIPLLVSSPGVGKSASAAEVARDNNVILIDTRLSTHEPQDLNGYPVYNHETDEAKFKVFANLFPTVDTPLPEDKDGWLIFLDEFTTIDEDMQAATYKLLLDRMIGQERLHEKVLIMLAGNGTNHGAVSRELGSAIYSRVVYVPVVAHTEEWIEDYALPKKLDPRVIAYLSNNPSKIDTFDVDESVGKSFGCPRTWAAASAYLRRRNVPKLDDMDAVALNGILGQEVGIPFQQFCNIFADAIPMAEILKDPLKARIPSDSTMTWVTTAMLQDNLTPANFDTMVDYVSRLGLVYQILFFRSMNSRFPELANHPKYKAKAVEIMKYIRKADQDD